MTTKVTDNEVIESFRAGDIEAFHEIVTRYTQRVHNLAHRISRNEEDTEEIVQDVFVTVYNKINKFEGKSAFSSWLYRITANAALMKLRKRKQTSSVSLDELAEVGGIELVANDDTAEFCSQKEVRTVLEKALGCLPADYRAIFVLRDVDKLSNQEVSDILGISVPAIKSRLHRSRLMLRKRLSRFYEDYTEGNKRAADISDVDLDMAFAA